MDKSTKNKVEDGRLVRPVEVIRRNMPRQDPLEISLELKQEIVPVQMIGGRATWELPGNQSAELEVRFGREVLTVKAFLELGGVPLGMEDLRTIDFLKRSIRQPIEDDLAVGVPLKAKIDEVKKQFAAWLRVMEAKFHPVLSHDYTYIRH